AHDHNVGAVVKRFWPRDEATLDLVTRATTAVATTTATGWAKELAVNQVAELLIALGPQSAGSELLRAGNMLALGRYASVTVPGLVASAASASFVAEGAAIPIRVLDTSKSAKLEPHKLATGFALSRELIESSNAEQLVRMSLVNSMALTLDAAL